MVRFRLDFRCIYARIGARSTPKSAHPRQFSDRRAGTISAARAGAHMILQRLTRRLRVFLPVLLTLLWALTATSQAATTRWHYAWRPGWLPGDPSVADQNQAAPIWASEAIQSAGMFIAIDPVTHIPTAPSDAQKRAFA